MSVDSGAGTVLKALTDADEIREAFDRLAERLTEDAEQRERRLNYIGGDPGSTLFWHPNEGVWASLDEYDNRFLCACGTQDPDRAEQPLTIVVALNPAFDSRNRHVSTFFAYDADVDEICLVHTGRFPRLGKADGTVLPSPAEVEWPDGKRKQGFEVLRLDDSSLVEQLARFVRAVEKIKANAPQADGPKRRTATKKASVVLPRKVSRKSVAGYVYVALLTKMSPAVYKIGRAMDVEKRLQQFSPKYPYEVEVVHRVYDEDCARLEREIHLHFGAWKTQGEWFHLPPDQLALLKQRWPGRK